MGVLPSLPALRSFTGFLARHGQQLQRLAIKCNDGTAEGEFAAAADAAICLSMAGAGGQLMELSASGHICSTEWLLTMPALRRLQLQSGLNNSPLHISPAISALKALSVLELSGKLSFPAATRLPPSLERVTLHDDPSESFPHQASLGKWHRRGGVDSSPKCVTCSRILARCDGPCPVAYPPPNLYCTCLPGCSWLSCRGCPV